jgi:hypothetical protein
VGLPVQPEHLQGQGEEEPVLASEDGTLSSLRALCLSQSEPCAYWKCVIRFLLNGRVIAVRN